MSILDKAKKAIADRQQAADAKAAAQQEVRNWWLNNCQSRAEAFLTLLKLPRAFETTAMNGTVKIRHKKKAVVEIDFSWDTRSEYCNGEYSHESEPFEVCKIVYHADWKPEGAEEYKRNSKGVRDTFYPERDDDQNELGEYLLRVMKNEFDFS